MNKFWPLVAVLIVVASVLLVFESQQLEDDRINFKDLETECRSGPAQADITVQTDNSFVFRGSFPESNTHAELDYSYSQTSDRIILDVKSDSPDQPESFVDECLASVIYHAETQPIEPGRYLVDVRHNGETELKEIIRVR